MTNKVAIVIGGGGYLCSEIARGYAFSGANVVILDIKIEKAKKVANNIVVNEPFTIDFSIVNNASRDLNLQVLWNNSNNNGDGNMNKKPFGVLGKSTKNIGCITPGSKIDCSVSFIAYKTGLYTLGDILIKDIFTNNIYNVKQNRKIFVP